MMSIYDHFSEEDLKILQERAKRIAQPPQADQDQVLLTMLKIDIQGENYAIMTESITGIYSSDQVVAIPCVPSYVAGIANIRGRIVPVFDLARLLEIPREDMVSFGDLVIVTNGKFSIALGVETIGDILTVPENDLAPIPLQVDAHQTKYLRGILPDNTILLDGRAILDDPKLIVDEAAGAGRSN